MMVEKLHSLVMDVEEIDPGSSSEDCYQLVKGIYGLCQAARQFWKKFVDTANKESFGPCRSLHAV